MMKINQNDIFFTIFTLWACDAPNVNDFYSDPPQARILRIENWLDHIQNLGGQPLFTSGRSLSPAHTAMTPLTIITLTAGWARARTWRN